jgi:hypothetical protein
MSQTKGKISTKKPITVYYLHYYDEDHKNPAFGKYKDFVTCVMAEDTQEAIEKTKIIAGNQNIKIMGIASGREEDVNEKHPLGTHEEIMPLGGWKNKTI